MRRAVVYFSISSFTEQKSPPMSNEISKIFRKEIPVALKKLISRVSKKALVHLKQCLTWVLEHLQVSEI